MSSTNSTAEPSKSPVTSDASEKKSIAKAPCSAPLKVIGSLDEYISRIHYCITSRAGTDTALLFLLYATRVSCTLLEHLGKITRAVQSASVIRKRWVLRRLVGFLSVGFNELGQSTRAALGTLVDIRAFGRLWGLFGIYVALKRLAKSTNDAETPQEASRKKFDNFISATQLLLIGGFYANDNLHYLSGRKILRLSPARRDQLSRLSLYSWTGFIVVDLARLLIERRRLVDQTASKAWREKFLRSVAWFPIALNYCMENGPLNDLTISLLALYPSAGGMADLWRESGVAIKA